MYSVVMLMTLAGTADVLVQSPQQSVRLYSDLQAITQVPVAGAPGDLAARQDAVLVWNDTVLEAIRADRTPPPLAARNLAMVHAAVYDDCPYCKGRGKVKSALTMSVEIQRKLGEILRKRPRDESDFQLLIIVHPTVLERLRTEDEKHMIEIEKRYFGKLQFRKDPALHAEQFKIVNVTTNEELASVGI